jgi:opacity protein-like surface antigen
MKKILLLSLMVVLVFASTSFAAEKYALGMGNIALKVDYINFTESVEVNNIDFDLELDKGIYVGLEGYYAIYPNLYLGLEAGWAGTSNDDDGEIDGQEINVDIDVTFIPVELNLKYVFELDPNWNIGVGAGISYSFFEIEADGIDESVDDWIFGGQVFADVNYKMSKEWFIGINGKYQFTDDLEFDNIDTETSADNWRVGAQIGYMW